jgi:probable lipoprotein NlpC
LLWIYILCKNNATIPRTSGEQERYAQSVRIKDLKTGDLVFFRPNKVGKVFHVALVVDNNRDGVIVIHSTSSRGVVEENITKSSYWSKKYWTGGRVYHN